MKTRFLLIALCVLSIAQSRPSSRWSEWADYYASRQGDDMAVTFTVWTNAAGGRDFNVAGNWTNGIPVDADHTAVFDGSVTQVGPTSNMDRGAGAFGVRTMPNYRGGIGTAAAPLYWTPAALSVTCRHGSGTAYLKFKAAAVAVVYLRGGGATVLADGSDPTSCVLYMDAGTLTVNPTANLDGAYFFIWGDQANVIITAGTGTAYMLDHLHVMGGTVTCARNSSMAATGTSTKIYMNGRSRVLYTGNFGDKNETVLVMYEGYFRYTPATQAAVLADVNVYGGVLDLSHNSLPVLTNLYAVGPYATVMGSPGEPGGPSVSYDMREDYP